ncbi:hypothetical protein FRX31_008186 [Thalictrum thalictroides]|uniref:RNase H type-1 domain-containing protein n=1 Tax=Thalictrum thalictroides TaxID=46969 RepID=A0A7J6WXP1_THATH|nr:hypothetical protein FRX31_008186 [Thalictrum thalictroides]
MKVENKLAKGTVSSGSSEIQMLESLNVQTRLPKAPRIRSCRWIAPYEGFIKMNTDGSYRKEINRAGIRVVFRDHNGSVKGGLNKAVRPSNSFMAECQAAVEGLPLAVQQGWTKI